MKFIVGLGNPGRRYEATPHNAGFEVVDRLAERWGLGWRANSRSRAEIAEGRVAESSVLMVKPGAFMNRSGQAVAELARQRELGEDDLLLITDDVSLSIGRIRLRPRGGHGGHNGLRSVIELLGHGDFARLRIGIAPTWEVDDLSQYVLSRVPPTECYQLAQMTDVAADGAEIWLREGIQAAAERFNAPRLFEEES